MQRRSILFLLSSSLVVGAFSLVGCSSGSTRVVYVTPDGATGSGDDGGGSSTLGDGGDSSATSGAFTMTATSPTFAPPVSQDYMPPEGQKFFGVTVTLANADEATPLPIDPVYFSVLTQSNLAVASQVGIPMVNACPDGVSVAEGGMLTCALVFAVSASDPPTRLLYADGHGRTATAAIPSVSGGIDGGENIQACIALSSGACISCVETQCTPLVMPSGPCSAAIYGAAQCTSCACVRQAEGPDCESDYNALATCAQELCPGPCPLLP